MGRYKKGYHPFYVTQRFEPSVNIYSHRPSSTAFTILLETEYYDEAIEFARKIRKQRIRNAFRVFFRMLRGIDERSF